jgi:hypothetical protein
MRPTLQHPSALRRILQTGPSGYRSHGPHSIIYYIGYLLGRLSDIKSQHSGGSISTGGTTLVGCAVDPFDPLCVSSSTSSKGAYLYRHQSMATLPIVLIGLCVTITSSSPGCVGSVAPSFIKPLHRWPTSLWGHSIVGASPLTINLVLHARRACPSFPSTSLLPVPKHEDTTAGENHGAATSAGAEVPLWLHSASTDFAHKWASSLLSLSPPVTLWPLRGYAEDKVGGEGNHKVHPRACTHGPPSAAGFFPTRD